VLALLSDTPLGADPGIPTLGAQGLKDFDYQGWYGLFAARGTPAPVLAYARQMKALLQEEKLTRLIVGVGSTPAYLDHEDAVRFVREEIDRHKRILEEFKPN